MNQPTKKIHFNEGKVWKKMFFITIIFIYNRKGAGFIFWKVF